MQSGAVDGVLVDEEVAVALLGAYTVEEDAEKENGNLERRQQNKERKWKDKRTERDRWHLLRPDSRAVCL